MLESQGTLMSPNRKKSYLGNLGYITVLTVISMHSDFRIYLSVMLFNFNDIL
jgi:hypothetical protein